MKDKILGIVHKHIIVNGNDIVVNQDSLASEIADMVKAFTEWLLIEQEIFMGELSEKYIINDNIHVNGKRLETIDELFDYWYDNIRKK